MKIIHLNNIHAQPVSHDPHIFKKVMIANGKVPHLSNFSQAIIKPGESVTPHIHEDMYEIFFINSGIGQLITNGSTVNIQKDSSVIIEPKEEHSFQNTGTEDLVMTYFGIVK